MIRLVVLVVLPLIFVACGENFEPRKSDQTDKGDKAIKTTTAPDLSKMSIPEALQFKYEKAQMVCQLWVQQGLELFTSNTPNATITWDLINDFATEKSFLMKGSSDFEGATASMDTVTKIDAVKVELRNNHSPFIELKAEYHYRIGTGKNGFFFGRGSSYGFVGEQVKTVLLNSATTFKPADGSHFNYLECTLETEPRHKAAEALTEPRSTPEAQ